MTALPIDVAHAVAAAGVDPERDDDDLRNALLGAIADRRGYIGAITVEEIGWTVELLSPVRASFEGRTRELALAWVLIYLMGEGGELGVTGGTG